MKFKPGDKVIIVDNEETRRDCINSIGKVFNICKITHDGHKYPYYIEGFAVFFGENDLEFASDDLILEYEINKINPTLDKITELFQQHGDKITFNEKGHLIFKKNA